MTIKYQRPTGAHAGETNLANRDKYQTDAAAQPKISISSSKMDGDFNYVVDALNDIDEASGTKSSIAERMDISFNTDGSLKASASSVMDDWMNHILSNISRVDNSTITFDGDQTGVYVKNRRVRLIVGSSPLFASVVSATYSAGITTLVLIDIYDGNSVIAIIDTAPTAIAYSPIMPGVIGNAVQRFKNMSLEELNIKKDDAVIILTDTAVSGKIYGLRSFAGNFEVIENTGTEVSPVWITRATVDASGYVIDDTSITTAKLAAGAVTGAKMETSGVTAGTYTLSTVTVDDKGRLTSASSGSSSAPSDASTTVKGIVELATNTEVTTGADTTRVASISSMKSHQGIAKFWVNFSGSGAVSIRDSYNVSSITDRGVGRYTVNITSAMGNANYCMSGFARYSAGAVAGLVTRYSTAPAQTASACPVETGNSTSGGYIDFTEIHVIGMGD